MEQPALQILNDNRVMSIATVRPDGWPQTTIVGYANRYAGPVGTCASADDCRRMDGRTLAPLVGLLLRERQAACRLDGRYCL